MKKDTLILLLCLCLLPTIALSQRSSGLDSLHKALYNSRNEPFEACHFHNQIATVHPQPDSALWHAQKGLTIAEKLNYEQGLSISYSSLGRIYKEMKRADIALGYHLKALRIRRKLTDEMSIAQSCIAIGNIYYEREEWQKSLNYYEEAIKFLKNVNPNLNVSTVFNNLGVLYEKLGKDKKALEELNLSLKSSKGVTQTATALNNLAYTYLQQGDYNSALKYFRQAIQTAKVTNERPSLQLAYQGISEAYAKLKSFEQAYSYHQLYSTLRDTLFTIENGEKLAKSEQQKQRIQLKLQEEELVNQKIQLYFFIVGFSLVAFIALLLYISNKNNEKMNFLLGTEKKVVENAKKEIEHKNKELEYKNKNIHASITYAQRIQTAMLPLDERIAQGLGAGNFFVLNKPRDIVSGDFYFYEEVNHIIEENTNTPVSKIIIAAADCTGHGVPGAFMSMIGNQILHETIGKNAIHQPDKILQQLHTEVMRTLKQGETQNKDGMDIALISLTKPEDTTATKFTKVEYAGAMNPLYYVQNNQLNEIKATKKGIGGAGSKNDKEMTISKQEIVLSEAIETTFYLFSDGFQDQFGGKEQKKFLTKRFRELLFSIHALPMQTQKEILDQTITEWIGSGEQTDDILVVGIKV